MDIGTFRGVMTAILMLLFIALVFWAYSKRRNRDFDEAARLPLDEDDGLIGGRAGHSGTERDSR
jgi:cytochrome c oxidase cbb3-type subunit 4